MQAGGGEPACTAFERDPPAGVRGDAVDAANPEVAVRAEPAVVPEFPALAPGIELCGQLQGSGFAAQQWLIQRDGRFLQVTAVLYHIAEGATGAHSLAEIAASTAVATGRAVSPPQVRALIERQLIPAGIVAPATPAAGPTASRRAPSALAVNMRLGVVGPNRIEPVTRFLQYLYWPPVVAVVLLAAAAGHIWLYLVHGAGGSVQSALTAPGALLAALGIFIVSACFHEIGHAAALRYAGGRVRGMGIGMYLLYPVFYTDVTDSYRFGRLARVRTDLGGFYFNLVFALGMLTLYAATGAELLLLVVVLTNFDILRQSLPFVRMDGYWVLADLTGVPDLFTHLPVFIRSRNPFRRDVAAAARFRMKGWVAASFVLYFAITVPLLLTALFFMVRNLPDVVSGAASSFAEFGRLFWAAFEAHEFLSAAGTAAQSAILGLTVLGLLYALGRVALDVGRGLWRWGRPTAERRAVSVAAGTAMTALVISLWLPQVPWPQRGTGESLAMRAALPAMAEAFTAPGIANGRPGEGIPLPAVDASPVSSARRESSTRRLGAPLLPSSIAVTETSAADVPSTAIDDSPRPATPMAGPSSTSAAGPTDTSATQAVRPAPAASNAAPIVAPTPVESAPPPVATSAVPLPSETPVAPAPLIAPATATPTVILQAPGLPPVTATATASLGASGVSGEAEVQTSIVVPTGGETTVAVGPSALASEANSLPEATMGPVSSVLEAVVDTPDAVTGTLLDSAGALFD